LRGARLPNGFVFNMQLGDRVQSAHPIKTCGRGLAADVWVERKLPDGNTITPFGFTLRA
jgi:hypothetical protein